MAESKPPKKLSVLQNFAASAIAACTAEVSVCTSDVQGFLDRQPFPLSRSQIIYDLSGALEVKNCPLICISV